MDKSAPIIQADEEDLPTVRFVKPDKPADLSYLYAKKDPDDIVVWRPRSIVPRKLEACLNRYSFLFSTHYP